MLTSWLFKEDGQWEQGWWRVRRWVWPQGSFTAAKWSACVDFTILYICIVWTTVYHSTEVVQSRDRCLEPTTIRIHTIQCRHVCTHCADLLSDLFARLALQLSVRPATSMVKPWKSRRRRLWRLWCNLYAFVICLIVWRNPTKVARHCRWYLVTIVNNSLQ